MLIFGAVSGVWWFCLTFVRVLDTILTRAGMWHIHLSLYRRQYFCAIYRKLFNLPPFFLRFCAFYPVQREKSGVPRLHCGTGTRPRCKNGSLFSDIPESERFSRAERMQSRRRFRHSQPCQKDRERRMSLLCSGRYRHPEAHFYHRGFFPGLQWKSCTENSGCFPVFPQ